MGSPDNAFAVEAVRILRVRGWLTDGSLREKDFREANLQRANLEKADLQGANFSWADMREANLTEANLKWANLGGVKFEKLTSNAPRAATLWYADLQNATLAGLCT